MALHYLTVQDILWINLQVTKKVQDFDYAKLEEATFYQYAYGESKSLIPQATRFAKGFVRMNPLDQGTAATAFVGLVTFLRMNGKNLTVDDREAASWFKSPTNLAEKTTESDGDHHELVPNVREIIEQVIADYPTAVSTLTA